MAGLAPRKSPCASCPYRLNAPSGVWDAEEYEKLLGYDGETFEQRAVSLFMCHQGEGELCAGWVGCHDPRESLAMRLNASQVDWGAVEAFSTTAPLHPSGKAAAEHGMRDLSEPSERAQETIEKIVKKRSLRGQSS